MNKFWYVAFNEYKRHVFRKGYILAILSVPLILFVSIGAGYLVEVFQTNSDPVGYVDLSGLLADPQPVPEGADTRHPVELITYPDEDAALAALDAEEIQAYYIIAEDYRETRAVSLTYYEEPGANAESYFRAFMRSNLLTEQPPDVVFRALDGLDMIVRTPDGSHEISERNILNIALPAATGFIFMFLLMTSSGYFAGAVAEEKENRTMEILATSMSTNQFITGKVVGILFISMTQLVAWILFGVIAFYVGGSVMEVSWVQNAEIKVGTILILVAILIPAYLMYAGLAVMVSGTVTEAAEGQQMTGMFSLPLAFSYWLAVLIIGNPHSPLSVILSLIPFIAPTAMPLRVAFSVVPIEQIIAATLILIASAVVAIWLAARAFELGMLRYGQKLSLRELFKKAKPRLAHE
jgi:ABC-2 type transport system permease protein